MMKIRGRVMILERTEMAHNMNGILVAVRMTIRSRPAL
jgi:hypothetical protein